MRKWILLGAAAIAIAAGGLVMMRRTPRVQATRAAVPASLPRDVILSGRVVPRTTVAVTAPMAGTLEAFFVDAGAEVIQGQLLGRIRNAPSDTAVQEAEAELDRVQGSITALNGEQLAARLEVSRADADRSRAQGELERLQKAYVRQKGLWDAGATARLTFEKSEKDYNDAKTAMETLDAASKAAAARAEAVAREIDTANQAVTEKTAAIERAKEQATSGEIHSPADGIVVARHGEPGEPVTSATKLMEIATGLTALQAIVAVDPSTLARVHAGQAATVKFGDEEIAGAVQEVRGGDVVVYFNSAAPITKLDVAVQVKIKF